MPATLAELRLLGQRADQDVVPGGVTLLELLDDRYRHAATLVTSQLPIAQWHAWIGDPTLADAILDRLVHNAHKLTLKGPSRRKETAQPEN